MTKDNCLAVLDIGTAKTVAFVLNVGHQAKPYVMGSGLSATSGLHKNKVVDEQALTTSLRKALRQAEQNAGCRVNKLFCNTAGAPVSAFVNRGTTAIGQKTKEISVDDIDRVIEASKILHHNSGQELVYAAPQQFFIDGKPTQEVLGKHGIRLDAETCVVTADAQNLADLANIVSSLGLTLSFGWIYTGMAIAFSVLTAEEQNGPTLVIDLGAGTTDVTIVAKRQPIFAFTLPIAGRHITNDLSIGLGVNLDEAEQLKIQYGVALEKIANPKITIKIGDSKQKTGIPQKVLAEIIEARLQEVFLLIQHSIEQAGYQMPAHTVLSGGTAMLPGMDKQLSSMWASATRISSPPYINGMPVNFNNAAYVSIAAMSLYVIHLNTMVEELGNKSFSGFFDRFFRLWKAFSNT